MYLFSLLGVAPLSCHGPVLGRHENRLGVSLMLWVGNLDSGVRSLGRLQRPWPLLKDRLGDSPLPCSLGWPLAGLGARWAVDQGPPLVLSTWLVSGHCSGFPRKVRHQGWRGWARRTPGPLTLALQGGPSHLSVPRPLG